MKWKGVIVMSQIVSLVTAPTQEPITLAEAKANSRIDTSDEDTLVTNLIIAAREWCEEYTGRSFAQQTWDLFLDSFPDVIDIPKPPLQSVTHVKYYDTDGVQQTLSNTVYTVDTDSTTGRVYLAYGESWPSYQAIRKTIEVRFVAGYDDDGASPPDYAANIPQRVKQACLLLVSHWFENREDSISGTIIASIPMGVKELLYPIRLLNV